MYLTSGHKFRVFPDKTLASASSPSPSRYEPPRRPPTWRLARGECVTAAQPCPSPGGSLYETSADAEGPRNHLTNVRPAPKLPADRDPLGAFPMPHRPYRRKFHQGSKPLAPFPPFSGELPPTPSRTMLPMPPVAPSHPS
jgi:hypothetical protein